MSDNFTRSKREKIDRQVTCQSKDLPAGCWCTGVRVSRIPLSGVEIELIKIYILASDYLDRKDDNFVFNARIILFLEWREF